MLTITTPLSDTALTALEVARVVDARGSACPGPLLEAKKGMGTIQVGQVLEIWSSDPATKGDIGAWSTKVGHIYLGYLPGEGYERIFVRRQK
jgi:TusA-related sulfurtransferase